MRDAFDLDLSVVHLNHGSFGAVPRAVAVAQRRVRERAEANPMRFHRVELPGLKEQARGVAAEFLGVGADDVALVRNVTQAAATVLAALADDGRLTAGDAMVLADHTYESVRNLARRTCRRTGAAYESVECAADADPDAIVAAYRRGLERAHSRGLRPSVVLVDHIVSPTGAVMPVSRICALAREFGALSFVDAAHAPGQVAARPAESGADLWASTWHKWGFAPRGTSALWASPAVRERLLPLASGAPGDTAFPLTFDRTGTDDYTGWCCLADAVAFWHDAGGPDIAHRSRTLLDTGAAVVRDALGADDQPIPPDPAPCMRLVPLPAGTAATAADAARLYERLSERGFEVQVVAHAGRGYVRLSASLYNAPDDYERLAKAMPDALP
ncbi:aminotransferase class V-fold PLP-dependent enzyme [Solicola gregarius]|uniref:Aminotransferase class V-fold PLP-dependent enzyme n=1 Tax=Solicola gregarius TaxID=2908642 RepID=A0AA46TIB9_9ACTN|nr:aminotransferase class V-fold PLP-dependent enzyme [Solicola gregarius]UYM05048.1 aminotransferase class V-fold PLP-dependent enzyme [Solicola gregarius]